MMINQVFRAQIHILILFFTLTLGSTAQAADVINLSCKAKNSGLESFVATFDQNSEPTFIEINNSKGYNVPAGLVFNNIASTRLVTADKETVTYILKTNRVTIENKSYLFWSLWSYPIKGTAAAEEWGDQAPRIIGHWENREGSQDILEPDFTCVSVR